MTDFVDDATVERAARFLHELDKDGRTWERQDEATRQRSLAHARDVLIASGLPARVAELEGQLGC